MSLINQKWDYPTMRSCADQLDNLYDRSTANVSLMDEAIKTLTEGVQAETGKAFIAAYSEHIPAIKQFGELLKSESTLLRTNANIMEEKDSEIAADIRRQFGI